MKTTTISWAFDNSDIQFQYWKLSFLTAWTKNKNKVNYSILIENKIHVEKINEFISNFKKVNFKIYIISLEISKFNVNQEEKEIFMKNKYTWHTLFPFLNNTKFTIVFDNDMIINTNYKSITKEVEKSSIVGGRKGGHSNLLKGEAELLNYINEINPKFNFNLSEDYSSGLFHGAFYIYNNLNYVNFFKEKNYVKISVKIIKKAYEIKEKINLLQKDWFSDEQFIWILFHGNTQNLSDHFNITEYGHKILSNFEKLEEWNYHFRKSESFINNFVLDTFFYENSELNIQHERFKKSINESFKLRSPNTPLDKVNIIEKTIWNYLLSTREKLLKSKKSNKFNWLRKLKHYF